MHVSATSLPLLPTKAVNSRCTYQCIENFPDAELAPGPSRN
jgi:hypothetical protein